MPTPLIFLDTDAIVAAILGTPVHPDVASRIERPGGAFDAALDLGGCRPSARNPWVRL